MEFGLTGVLARCTGLKRDIRLSRLETYANYPSVNFRSYIGQHGDCYDRFLIRMYEMVESLNIINQVIKKCESSNPQVYGGTVNSYEVLHYVSRASMDRRSYNKNLLMEDTIKDFKY